MIVDRAWLDATDADHRPLSYDEAKARNGFVLSATPVCGGPYCRQGWPCDVSNLVWALRAAWESAS